MKRVLVIFRRPLLTLAVAALLVLVFYVFLLPPLVRGQLRAMLHDAGLTRATYSLDRVTPTGIDISELDLAGDGRLVIRYAHLAFSPRRLVLDRHIDTVTIGHIRYAVAVTEQGLDLGPLAGLKGGDAAGGGRLPFDSIEVRSALLVVKHNDQTYNLPMSFDVAPSDTGVDITAQARLADRPSNVSLSVTGDDTQTLLLFTYSGPLPDVANQLLAPHGVRLINFNALAVQGGVTLVHDGGGGERGATLVVPSGVHISTGDERAMVLLPAHDLRLHGPRLAASVRGHTGLDGGEWTISARASVRSARQGVTVVQPNTSDAPLVQLDIGGLSLRTGKQGPADWSVDSQSITLRVGPTDHTGRGGAFALKNLAATLALAVTGDSRELGVRLTESSTATLDRLLAGGTALGPLALAVPEGEDLPLATIALAAGEPVRVRAAGALAARQPVDLRTPGLEDTALRNVRLALDAAVGDQPHLAATLTFRIDTLEPSAADVVLRDVAASVPVVFFGGTAARPGTLRIGAVTWSGRSLPGVEFDLLAGADRGVAFSGVWNLTDTAPVTLAGRVALDARRVELYAALPPSAVHRDDFIGSLVKRSTGAEFTGTVALDARANLGAPGVTPAIALTVDDGVLSWNDGVQRIDGVAATLRLDSVAPLRSAPGQRITWRTGRVGDVALANGLVQYQVEAADTVLVERAALRVGESGRVYSQAVRFNPARPDVNTQLFLEDMQLRDWLGTLTADRATGQGLLYGRVGLRLRTHPRLRVALGEGFLVSQGEGVVQVRDAEQLEKTLAQNDPRFAQQGDYTELVQQRVVQALQRFGYDDLGFEFVERDGKLSLRVKTSGKGVAPPHQELHLTVNFNNIDDLLDEGLRTKLGFEQAADELMRKLQEPTEQGEPQ